MALSLSKKVQSGNAVLLLLVFLRLFMKLPMLLLVSRRLVPSPTDHYDRSILECSRGGVPSGISQIVQGGTDN